MKRVLGRTVPAYGALTLATLILAGCGGGPSGPSGSPAVSNVQVVPLTSGGTQAEWLLTATVTDRDNNVAAGRAEITVMATGEVASLGIGQVQISLSRTAAQNQTGNAGLSAATLVGNTIRCIFFIQQPPAGQIDLAFAVIDSAGNRSNDTAFSVTSAPSPAPTPAAAPSPRGFEPREPEPEPKP